MSFPAPPEFWQHARAPELWRLMSQSVRGLLRGKSNNVRIVTLTPSASFTDLADENITAETIALFSPQTASAAAALATTFAITTVGKVTFTHGSDPATDRTFGIVLTG